MGIYFIFYCKAHVFYNTVDNALMHSTHRGLKDGSIYKEYFVSNDIVKSRLKSFKNGSRTHPKALSKGLSERFRLWDNIICK